MHNHDDKYPARPGFEPGISRLQAPVDTNEASGRPTYVSITILDIFKYIINCQLFTAQAVPYF